MKNNASPDQFEEGFEEISIARTESLRRMMNGTPADRQRETESRINETSQCARCKSRWFTEMTFNQYAASTYSSSPGGDIQPVSLMAMPIRVCLCGLPLSPNLGGANMGGRTPNENLSSFGNSLQAAIGWMMAQNAPLHAVSQPLAAPVKDVAAEKERAALKEEVVSLIGRLAILENSLEALSRAPVAVAATAPVFDVPPVKIRQKPGPKPKVKVPEVALPETVQENL